MPNACKSHGVFGPSGARLRSTWLTYPGVGDNGPKGSLIPHTITLTSEESFGALGGGRGKEGA